MSSKKVMRLFIFITAIITALSLSANAKQPITTTFEGKTVFACVMPEGLNRANGGAECLKACWKNNQLCVDTCAAREKNEALRRTCKPEEITP